MHRPVTDVLRTPPSFNQPTLRRACLLGAGLLSALALLACDDRAASNPGSAPANIGPITTTPSGNAGSQAGSDGLVQRTPATPDIRSGGSTGPAGVPATPDTSGGPSSGSTSTGASDIGGLPGPANASSGPTGSTPQSSTAN